MAPTGRPPPPISITPTILTPDDNDDTDYEDDAYHQTGQAARASYQSRLAVPDRHASRGSWESDSDRYSPVASSFLSPDMASAAPRGGKNFMKETTPPIDELSSAAAAPNPFNFKTQVISTSPVKPNVGQRRGHKYKHSSISAQHQIFQEPPPRPPLALPRDLPVPTTREAWKSMSQDQRTRFYWCMCHFAVATSLFLSGHGCLAMTALSHLVFFDVGSALICVAVEVLGNFEVWKRSSIRHPFGLERAEVLAGFAMSVFLIFGGFDLVSHNVKHVLEGGGDHDHHAESSAHDEVAVQAGHLDIASLAAIAATLVSAYGLRNQARISKMMRVSYLASMPSILSNPFHFLTLSMSTLMVLLPLLSIPIGLVLDSVLCGLVAIAMFGLGLRLAVAQGLMLLMSYGGHSDKSKNMAVGEIVREIEGEPGVERVEEAQFWQVHYGLCMANLKVCVTRGNDDAMLSRLRSRINTLIQNRLGEGYGKGGNLKWEVSLEMGSGNGVY